jgi:hypothetical protein
MPSTRDETYDDENLMTSSASGEDLFQTLASASTDGSYSSSSGDVILSSLPLFQEIGSLIHSYRTSDSLISPASYKNAKQPSIIEEELEEEERSSSSSKRALSLQQQPAAVTTIIPIETMPSAPLSEKTSDCIGLGYISSASTDDISPSTSSFTAAGERIIPSMSSSLSDVSCPEGKFKDMEAKGAPVGESKFDTLILHIASRNSEVISATTALFKSPRIAADNQFHQTTQGALFLSPRNHISSTPREESLASDSCCLGESTSKGNVFTFDGFNMAEDEETTDDGIEEIKGAKSLSSDFSSSTSDTMEHSEAGLLKPFQSLISRIIQLPKDAISPHQKIEDKSNIIPQSTVLPQHDFQKDVDNFTKRLREIKENVRCDVYLIEGDQSQNSSSVLSMESNSQEFEEEDDDKEKRSNYSLNKTLLQQQQQQSQNKTLLQQQQQQQQSKTKKNSDEEVLYVFSVSQAEQNQSNIHLRSDSNNLGAEKNTLLRTHCEKHVNPEILDHINKYGSFEIYKILPPPPPPPCTPPAMKLKHQQKYKNNQSHAPHSNCKDSYSKTTGNNCLSFSADKEKTGYLHTEAESICDLSRYKFNELPSSDSTDAESRDGQKSAFRDTSKTRKKTTAGRKHHTLTDRDHKDSQQNVSPLILRERRDDNQASDTSFQSNLHKLRQSRIAALKIKNSSRKEEERLNVDSAEHENSLNNSGVTTTTVEEVSTNIEKPKSDADASRRARILAMKKKSNMRGVEKISKFQVGENNEETGVILQTGEDLMSDRPMDTNFTRKARIRDLTKRSGLKQGEENSQSYEVSDHKRMTNEALQSSTGTINTEKGDIKETPTESCEHRSTRLARISALRAKSNATRAVDNNHVHSAKSEAEEDGNNQQIESSEEPFLGSEFKSNASLSRKARITELMGRKKLTTKGVGVLQSRVEPESVANLHNNNEHDSAKQQQEIREETLVSPVSTSTFNRKTRLLELKNKKKTVARLGSYSNEEKTVISVDEGMKIAAQGETVGENQTSLSNSLATRRHARVLELKKKKMMS